MGERVLVRAVAEAVPEIFAGGHDRHDSGEAIELLHVNCEGCEYDVVEGLHSSGLLVRAEQVQIATHLLDRVPPTANFQEAVEMVMQLSVKRYCEMHLLLSESHVRVWGLPWVW